MKITLKYRAGLREVEAADCGVAGLAIHQDPDEPGCFTITHLRSGLAVAHFDEPEAALAAAQIIAPMCDWTLAGSEIATKLRGIDILNAVYDLDGWLLAKPPGDRSDLEAAAR